MRPPGARQRRLLAGAAGALVISTGLVVATRSTSTDTTGSRRQGVAAESRPADGASAETRVAQAARTARLQQRVEALASDVAALRSARAGPPEQARAPAEAHAQLTEAQRADEEARIFSEIGRSFEAQPIDPVWSDPVIHRIEDYLRAQPYGSSGTERVECRASACRIELGVSAGTDLAVIRDGLRSALADVLSTGASKQDEAGRFVVYLGKDPQALGLAPRTQP